jgi:DNA-binding transcriptional LysR family regulator
MSHNASDLLTPDALSMLLAIEETGSFAAAARQRGLVPSALTYRVRQIEDALDVLLFDRSSRQAKPTEAGKELLREAKRLLHDVDALANRVKRVATGWESVLTVAVDSIISRSVIMELCEGFLALNPPTRLRIRYETLSGTLAALKSGQADLALGVFISPSSHTELLHETLGQVSFVYAIAPHHPLASASEPLTDAVLQQYRAVAVADSVPPGRGRHHWPAGWSRCPHRARHGQQVGGAAQRLGRWFFARKLGQTLLGKRQIDRQKSQPCPAHQPSGICMA